MNAEPQNSNLSKMIRENLPLFIGFCIPLVILFVFLTFQSINKSIIRDPLYGAVFVADYFPDDRYKPYTVLVEHGKLVIQRNKPEPGSVVQPDYTKMPSLFYFDPKTLQTRYMNIGFKDISQSGRVLSPEIDMVNAYQPLIAERVSPDGYIFSYRAGMAENKVAGVVSSSFYHQGHAIYKGGKIINIVYGGRRVLDPQFLAWVNVSGAVLTTPAAVKPGTASAAAAAPWGDSSAPVVP